MLHEELEEQFQSLRREVDELRAEVAELKKRTTDDEPLLPGVECDFAPSTQGDKSCKAFMGRIVAVVKESDTLGLTDDEWRMFSSPDE